MSDQFDVYKAVLEDTGRFQLRFDTTFNANRALILAALGTASSGAVSLLLDPGNVATLILTLASCVFGALFSSYLARYTHQALGILRTRYEWLLKAETLTPLHEIGADLFTFEAKHVKRHKAIVAEGFGQTQALFAYVLAYVFLGIMLIVAGILMSHYGILPFTLPTLP